MREQTTTDEAVEAIRLRLAGRDPAFSKRLTLAGCAAACSLVAQHGFVLATHVHQFLNFLDVFLAIFFVVELTRLARKIKDKLEALRHHSFEILLLTGFIVSLVGAAFITLSSDQSVPRVLTMLNVSSTTGLFFWLVEAFVLANVCILLLRLIQRIIVRDVRAEWLLGGSFAALILIGTVLLLLPRAGAVPNKPITLMDAVFTSTSAACVTGLVVRDTGTEFSTFGQMIILALFQVGGLGIVTFVAFISVVSMKRLPVSQMVAFREIINAPRMSDLKRSIAGIILLTVVIEAIGVLMLYSFLPAGTDAFARMKWSLFHTVSAFCNAGFALQSDSLETLRHDVRINLLLSALIILGGIGFLVIPEILGWILARLGRILRLHPKGNAPIRLSVQSQLSLRVTCWLLIIGFACFWLLEFTHTLGHEQPGDGFLISFFQSVSARTAGFNSVTIGDLQPATLLLITILMVIGACPVSAGGGIKTVTFGILLLALRSMILRREKVEVFGRTLPHRALITALSVFVLYVMAAASCLFLMTVFDPQIPLRSMMFEVISALSTVGLSTGITAELSNASKIVLCAAMFFGRVGPISLVLCVFQTRRQVEYEFPAEEVVVG